MKGVVYKSTGSWYLVKNEKGAFCSARIKGVFKLDQITSTNPVSVGDVVELETEDQSGEKTFTITAIQPRKNYINRQSPRHKHQQHIVAANIDQSILFATLREPRTSQGFIDRFLVVCEMYHIPSVIIFNKSELYRKKEDEQFVELKNMYEAIGYQVCLISVFENSGITEVKELLKNKISLVSGHSGVGKSTFINSILPDLGLKTQEVSGWSGKGLHTTTFAEMFDLPDGGSIIDTPGMREFGLIGVRKQELSHYFPEMKEQINECQFNNCLHMNEPGCAVKEAVTNEKIHLNRYISYCKILESLEEKGY